MWFVNWAIVCASSVKDVPCKDMCGHLAPPRRFPHLALMPFVCSVSHLWPMWAFFL